MKKVILILIWLIFIGYGFTFAPPSNPNTIDLIINLSSGKWFNINSYVVCLFNIMGILPFIYASLLIIDGQGQKITAAPFVTGSFFLGAFALLPYFALRQPNTQFIGEKTQIIKVLDSRLFAIIITIACLILITVGITTGDWQDFISQWQTSKFINVMSLDFGCLCCLFPIIVNDDLQKRGANHIFYAISFIPLIGTLIYLCFRPALKTNSSELMPPASILSRDCN